MLLPAAVWFLNAFVSLAKSGIYSFTSLLPFPFRVHTLSLLSMTAFYAVTFLFVMPRKPLKNLAISASLLFVSNALYELIYGVLYDWTSMIVTVPLVLGGTFLLAFLDRRFHFVKTGKARLLLFVLGFSILLALMITLYQSGFFAEVHLYLTGKSTNDPHNPLWIMSKILCLWMLFPLLDLQPVRALHDTWLGANRPILRNG